MDGPVGAGLAIFARAVERINDPHPLGVKPRGIVLFLFGKHGVVRTVRPQRLHDEGVGGAVAGPAQRLALKQAGTLEGEEQIARHMGDMGGERSEEHTSELQSLMRISYAVFCLKKKKKQQ